jgi:hypothetical protein
MPILNILSCPYRSSCHAHIEHLVMPILNILNILYIMVNIMVNIVCNRIILSLQIRHSMVDTDNDNDGNGDPETEALVGPL